MAEAQATTSNWFRDILGSIDSAAATYRNVSDAIDANDASDRQTATTVPAVVTAPTTPASGGIFGVSNTTWLYVGIGGAVLLAVVLLLKR